MNILIDIGHPAHVHLFARAAKIWQGKGHQVLFTIRNRPMVPELLEALHFQYSIASTPRTGVIGQAVELLEHDWQVFCAARRFRADIMLGTSVSITHVSKLTPARSVVFNEDDADYIKPFAYLAYPFADAIVIPACLRDKKTNKHYTYEGYHELAYLHPNQFTPDPAIFSELGMKDGEPYFILRLVAFKAHHDTGQRGLSINAQRKLINLLNQYGKVFITNEGKLPEEFRPYQLPIPPHRIHHALYYAKMLISDGQTMTIEAAVLGTPSIRCNTFIGKCSVIEELEHKYQLTFGFLPNEENKMLDKITLLLKLPDLQQEWAYRREKMLSEKVDLTSWMVNFIDKFE